MKRIRRQKDRMKRNTKIALVLCLAALGTAIAPRASECQNRHDSTTHPLTFTTIDVPGATASLPRDINPAGDILGFYGVGAAFPHGYLLQAGTYTDFDFPGAVATRPPSINPQGDIVGFYVAGGVTHGFLLDKHGSFTSTAASQVLTSLGPHRPWPRVSILKATSLASTLLGASLMASWHNGSAAQRPGWLYPHGNSFRKESAMRKVMDALSYACFCMAVATSAVPAHAQGAREATAGSYLDRGQSWVRRGELERAIADFNLALEFYPGFAGAYQNRALVRLRKGDLEGALADLDRALNLDPRLVEAYLGRSEIRYRQGALEGAISDSTKAIELNPGLAEAWNNRALARQEKGDLDGALADYDRSVQLNPKAASTYNNRGGSRYLKGDFEGAIADQTRALKLDSRFAEAFADRGIARCAKGMPRVHWPT
jgi:tetratricopeptide (TPR) repeat protein